MKNFFLLILVLAAVILIGVLSFIQYWPSRHKENLMAMRELKLHYPALPTPESGTVLMIYAHSDDELGTIAQVAKFKRENPELTIKWYIVSDGNRGFIYPGTCKNLSKTECRAREALQVADCAGLQHPLILNLPDGSIDETKNLKEFLSENVPELNSGDIKFIFTHDNRGLYGHPDHLAVYDAVNDIAREKKLPMVTLALPQYFKEGLIMMEAAKLRESAPITHALSLEPLDIQIKLCASRAHASQKLIINLLMFQGLDGMEFFKAAPREFLNLD